MTAALFGLTSGRKDTKSPADTNKGSTRQGRDGDLALANVHIAAVSCLASRASAMSGSKA
jgi:hypothetical protein